MEITYISKILFSLIILILTMIIVRERGGAVVLVLVRCSQGADWMLPEAKPASRLG